MKKYIDGLKPEVSYLKDLVVLAQAWKKSQKYIREVNWYADTLELDISTIMLNQQIKNWKNSFHTKNSPVRIVWAPKNQEWDFTENGWNPVEEDGENNKQSFKTTIQKLRPLAHISIQDQVKSSSLMMCLANMVETFQGPTEVYNSNKYHTYSYGNRLNCNWVLDESQDDISYSAKFKWGNAETYRKYYSDYQKFLKRPIEIMEMYQEEAKPNSRLFVLSFDLKSYYTKIEKKGLLNAIYKIAEIRGIEIDTEFQKVMETLLDWEVNENDLDYFEEQLGQRNIGLPQGLVASGFFSNAYLAIFDKEILTDINNSFFEENSIRALDYCRYVDDIRIVVECRDSNYSEEEIIKEIQDILKKKLEKYSLETLMINKEDSLVINEDKTKITSFEESAIETTMSASLRIIQNQLSGPANFDDLQSTTNDLFRIFENITTLNDFKKKETANVYKLANIFKIKSDIRDDTIKRFIAARIYKVIKEKGLMATKTEEFHENNKHTIFSNNPISESKQLEMESERAARMLISGWAHNVSLIPLLRNGLLLNINTELIDIVFNDLNEKLSDNVNISHSLSVYYIFADLFRMAAVQLSEDYEQDINKRYLKERLIQCAFNLLRDNNIPWYLKQQIYIFLISQNEWHFEVTKYQNEIIELSNVRDLISVKKRDWDNHQDSMIQLSYAIILYQMKWKTSHFIDYYIYLHNNLNIEKQQMLFKHLIEQQPKLAEKVFENLKRMNDSICILLIEKYPSISLTKKSTETELRNNYKYPLATIIKNANNPFVQENAILKLALELVKKRKEFNNLSLFNIMISSSNWRDVNAPQNSILNIEFMENQYDIEFPEWIEESSDDIKFKYSLGMILRSAMTSSLDYTSHTFLFSEDVGVYKGIKSSAYSRSFSLINKGKGFNNNLYPISPWMTELLFKLLKWPGIEIQNQHIPEWEEEVSLNKLGQIIKKRFLYQKKLFGVSSNTPVYVIPSIPNNRYEERNLRIATIQSLLPRQKDFNIKDPSNWSLEFRKIQRRHLADLTSLLKNQLKATDGFTDEKYHSELDIIVFPELSIHEDDLPLLRKLSDETKAHIFAGLSYIKKTNSNAIINTALWLLRDETSTGREFRYIYQGKKHITLPEKDMKIESYRPYQVVIEIPRMHEKIRISGSICYDATDMKITSDLRDISDIYIISALNKDVQTFDSMATYLNYHMFQPIVLVNTGEFGGSTIQAPYEERHMRTATHVHGGNQIAISIFNVDVSTFKNVKNSKKSTERRLTKTPPAGYLGRFHD